MAKASKKATPKKPPDKYDEKLAVKGTFSDVFKGIKKNKEDKKTPAPNDLEDYQELDERELGGEG